MENATKALLIAAAVLIVIVLIALGVALLNSGSDVTGQARSVSESTSVQTFNAQFSAYIGDRQTAASVRSLIIAAKASNKSNADQVKVKMGSNVLVKKTDETGVPETTDTSTLLKEGHSYKVVPTYGTNNGGRITEINVSDNNSTTTTTGTGT